MRTACLLEMKARKNIFLETAFYRTTKDKYIAGQTSRTRPVEAAFCCDKQRRRISVRVHFLGTADPHKLAMVEYHCGHDPGNVALRPRDIPMSADLARNVGVGIKLNIKVDRPTALVPEMGCSKSACSTGHYRQNSTTFGHQGQKCVSDHDGSDLFRSKTANTLKKLKPRDSPVINPGSQGHVTYDELINTCKDQRNTNLTIDGGPRT